MTHRIRFATVSIAGMMFALLSAPRMAGADWPNWRGPQRNGVAESVEAPLEWSAEQGILWKTPLVGSGIASPIVWGKQIFVATADGPRQSNLRLWCYASDTGEKIWQRQFWGTAPTLFHASKGGMASPTPLTDGQHVYGFFATGDVFCLDMDGNLAWHRSLADEYGGFENRFGHTSSPLMLDDLLIVQCDHYGQSYLVAIDKHSGKDRWRVAREGVWHSWSSPQLVPAGKKQELIICSSEVVDAFDPQSGEKLWQVKGMQRECIPTPVFGNGLLYAVSGPKGKTFAIRPGGRGDVGESHVAWQTSRGGPFVPSPILVGKLLYLIDDQGIASCLDAERGNRVWQKRLAGEFTASPVAAGDRIYFTNDAGETFVVRGGQQTFEQLARNALNESVYASAAISGGRIYFRTAQHLVCVGG